MNVKNLEKFKKGKKNFEIISLYKSNLEKVKKIMFKKCI